MEEEKYTGKVVSVQGPVVDIKFENSIPKLFSMVKTQTIEGKEVILEIAEHRPGNIGRCIAINSTLNLQRNAKAFSTGNPIEVPIGDEIYSRILNIIGQPIDNKTPIESKEKMSTKKFYTGTKVKINKDKM